MSLRKLIVITHLMVLSLMNIGIFSPVFAQGLPTATPSPIIKPATPTPGVGVPLPTDEPHKSIANCDLCGYCQGVAKVPGSWQACVRCLYPEVAGKDGAQTDPTTLGTLTNEAGLIPTPDPNHYYTGFGCLSTQPGEFTAQMSSFFFSIIGGIAFLSFIYGAAVIATSRSDAGRLNQGRRILIGSIVGLLFALMSVFIIQFLARSLGLPGIQ